MAKRCFVHDFVCRCSAEQCSQAPRGGSRQAAPERGGRTCSTFSLSVVGRLLVAKRNEFEQHEQDSYYNDYDVYVSRVGAYLARLALLSFSRATLNKLNRASY